MTRATLIYDGDCGLCRSAVEWIRARDRRDVFEYLPYQNESFAVRFPDLSREACSRAFHLVREDGAIEIGADALPTILSHLPGWRLLAPVVGIAGLRPMSRWLYARIARNRKSVSSSPECELRP